MQYGLYDLKRINQKKNYPFFKYMRKSLMLWIFEYKSHVDIQTIWKQMNIMQHLKTFFTSIQCWKESKTSYIHTQFRHIFERIWLSAIKCKSNQCIRLFRFGMCNDFEDAYMIFQCIFELRFRTFELEIEAFFLCCRRVKAVMCLC